MSICCCSLAGTRACDTCPNGPMSHNYGFQYAPQLQKFYPDGIDYKKLAEELVKQLGGK